MPEIKSSNTYKLQVNYIVKSESLALPMFELQWTAHKHSYLAGTGTKKSPILLFNDGKYVGFSRFMLALSGNIGIIPCIALEFTNEYYLFWHCQFKRYVPHSTSLG